MAKPNAEIVPARRAGVSPVPVDPDLILLVQQCRGISESLRISVIEHYWRLGEAIYNARPEDDQEQWTARATLALERELGIDRTTIWRSQKLFETFQLSDIVASGQRTWGKLRLLLAISEVLRTEILARIDSGELRTTDAVRDAIRSLHIQIGQRPAPLLRPDQLELFGVPHLTVERFSRGWSKAPPSQRAAALRSILIPQLGLEGMDRKAALDEIRGLHRALNDYEANLA